LEGEKSLKVLDKNRKLIYNLTMNKINYYNHRNNKGQFARRISIPRAKDGKFTSATKPRRIVNGRLYGYKGIQVRLRGQERGKALISVHNQLFGFVDPSELQLIGKAKVKSYLANS